MSNMNKAFVHPAYQQIIGMGKAAPAFVIRVLLRELSESPNHWFLALKEITGEDPALAEDTFDGAVAAWLKWGKEHSDLT